MIRKRTWAFWNQDGAKGAALAALLGLVFFALPFGQSLKNLSYELAFLFRQEVRPTEVLILYMDDASHDKLHQKWDRPWDRSVHAQLLKRLTALHAKAVVFDLLFDAPSSATTDAEFLSAVRQHGNVVVTTKAIPHVLDGEVIGMKLARLFTNFPHWGVAESSGEDKMVRQHYRDSVSQSPSVAWTTAELTLNPSPTNSRQPRWINYYGPPGTIPFLSYYEALETNRLTLTDLSNKVVFIGAQYSTGNTGGRGTDDFRTPYTRWTGLRSPGVEITATTYLNLVRGDWLNELPPWVEVVLLCLGGFGLGYGLTRCSPMRATRWGLGAGLIVAVAAMVLVWQTRIWFPWLIICGVQIPVALCWSVLAYTRQLSLERPPLAPQPVARTITADVPLPTAEAASVPAARCEPAQAASAGVSSAFRSTQNLVPNASHDQPPPIPDHTLLRLIGHGAYGQVWLARDVIGTYHAVKIVYRNTFSEAAPFDREFRGIQKFTPISRSHPGFVHILHVGRNDEAGYFYCIMELGDDELSGQQIVPDSYSPKTLARELKRRGRLPVPECLQLSLNLVSALEHLHQHQLIHRDIKPSNIIFANDLPKFADIGLVTDLAQTGRDVTYLGTQGYIAPEGPGTAAADVYSLGKVLYEAVTGWDRNRFPELPTEIVHKTDLPTFFQLNKIIVRACETEPRQRYRTAAEMQADLVLVEQRLSGKKQGGFWRRH